MISEVAEQLATATAKGADDIIHQAINRAIGERWTLDEIKNRGRVVVWPNKVKQFLLDDRPILVMYPEEFELNGTKMDVSFKYRILV